MFPAMQDKNNDTIFGREPKLRMALEEHKLFALGDYNQVIIIPPSIKRVLSKTITIVCCVEGERRIS
jgi:hypothetical protein